MSNLQPIRRCLISVSNKSGIIELAKFLVAQKIEIISTGGTYKLLRENQIAAIEISDFTNFPEIMDGRVKTLHPKVHGALLGVLSNEQHQKQAKENGIESIDLLVVNLYPFVETTKRTSNEAEIIENIDIGGPAMIRSAAKNFVFKTVITDVLQYQKLQDEILKNNGATDFEFRKKLAAEAFKNIAIYDQAIANWFNGESSSQESLIFNDSALKIFAEAKQVLRYGENSHQKASVYKDLSNTGIVAAKQIQGKELSYNNLNDSDSAYQLILEFENPACAIIKHTNPCGVATNSSLLIAYQKALASDPKSAFGGIVALNFEVDEDLAGELAKMFFEVVIAPKFSEKALAILAIKKNLRLLLPDFKKIVGKQVKSISGGFLVQDLDDANIDIYAFKQVSKTAASKQDLEQLAFAMKICKHIKSNAIVVAKNFQTFGLGVGQTSRVDACEIACENAAKKMQEFLAQADKNNLEHELGDSLVLASDAFFPFADNVEIAHKFGIKAIVAPSGSIRDGEVIAKADELGIALYFLTNRHFRH